MSGSKTALFLFIVSTLRCTPDDEQRCDDMYEFDGESCVEISDETPADETQTDGSVKDSADETIIPEGMGLACTENGGQCDDREASYCTANPMAPDGYCTITDCAAVAQNCPEGYKCCEMTVGNPPAVFCATESDFTTMSGIGLCSE